MILSFHRIHELTCWIERYRFKSFSIIHIIEATHWVWVLYCKKKNGIMGHDRLISFHSCEICSVYHNIIRYDILQYNLLKIEWFKLINHTKFSQTRMVLCYIFTLMTKWYSFIDKNMPFIEANNIMNPAIIQRYLSLPPFVNTIYLCYCGIWSRWSMLDCILYHI